jgi:predicted RND superfamily exporter protein
MKTPIPAKTPAAFPRQAGSSDAFRRYAEWIVQRRVAVVVFTILMTVFALFQAKNVKLIIDMSSTLPQSHPYIATGNEVQRVFGLKNIVVIGITPKTGDVYQPAVLEKVRRITDAMVKIPGVIPENILSLSARRAKVISSTADGIEVKPIYSRGPQSAAQVEAMRALIAKNPVFVNAIISADGRTTAVVAQFKEPALGFRSIIDQVNTIVGAERDANTDIDIGGEPSYLAQAEHYSERMGILLPIAIGILSLILYAGFRTKQGAALPLVTAITAVIWAVGVMGALGISLDVFNATTPILILAVATGHAVQMMKRYYEEYERVRREHVCTPEQANHRSVVTSLVSVGPVMITAGTVAALGFFSLLVFEISTIRTFGIFTGIGIVAALLLEMSFIPAMRAIMSPPVDRPAKTARQGVWSRLTALIGAWVTAPGKRSIYIAFLMLGLLALVGAQRVIEDNSVKSFFGAQTQVASEDRRLNDRLAGSNTLFVVVDGGGPDAIKNPSTLKSMEKLQRFLDDKPYVGKTVSMADFVKRMNQAMHNDDPAYFAIPDDGALISQYLLLYSISGEPEDFNSYVDNDYRKANLAIYLKTDSSAYGQSLIKEINAFAKDNFAKDVSLRIGGSVPQSAALSDVMVQGKLLNILQIAAVVFVVTALALRSLVGGLLILVPLLFAVLANFGIMGWFGINLNVPTSLTSAMAVGIGADFAIYLIFRLREELKMEKDAVLAVRNVINTAGQAILFVAIAVAAGYGVLLLSFGFNVHQWLAMLIGAAMICSALAALILVPALILTFRPAFIFRKSA